MSLSFVSLLLPPWKSVITKMYKDIEHSLQWFIIRTMTYVTYKAAKGFIWHICLFTHRKLSDKYQFITVPHDYGQRNNIPHNYNVFGKWTSNTLHHLSQCHWHSCSEKKYFGGLCIMSTSCRSLCWIEPGDEISLFSICSSCKK